MKVFGVVGWKNSGKTGLVERLVAEITGRGYSVSTIKHAHHSFDVDQPGRDSWRHRQAGAEQVLLSSRQRWALMTENRGREEAGFSDILSRLDPVDLVLVEGFKAEEFPKLEVHRQETGHPLIAATDKSILAVAADGALENLDRPVFDLDDVSGLADFILTHAGLERKAGTDGSGDRHALPAGVDWIPVDEVQRRMQAVFGCVVGAETIPLDRAAGRILAEDIFALRDSPPRANSAVDGYGFAREALGEPPVALSLVAGRAEPGLIASVPVPAGAAMRVLTGAPLPEGVDTVALQEDVRVEGGKVELTRLPRQGANTRRAGEDIRAGAPLLSSGRMLGAGDCALLASVGQGHLPVRRRLRVAVLSTGNELVDPGSDAAGADIFDANRPMLLNLAQAWGTDPLDAGQASDDRDAIAAALTLAADQSDVILTSGGASAGDEDHLAALLRTSGRLDLWRIAVKPGRPLALGHWQGKPVFALPGNPVAAFVCALIFARPAVMAMAGAGWQRPAPLMLPAGFRKSKRAGRREYLRARMGTDGKVEVFGSEGSGRISGLSWAEGLVELPDEAIEIVPGTLVRYLPFAAFGLGRL